MQLNIKLSEAKMSIGIPTFERDDLLRIALTDLSTLNQVRISLQERKNHTRKYRQLAILGDALFDAVLIDYLLQVNSEFTQEDIDGLRQEIASKDSLTKFAIELGLPDYSSSWSNLNRQPPQKEPRVWCEMFEACIGVIFIDGDRDFLVLSEWLCDRFISPATARTFDEYFGTAYEPDEEIDPSKWWN